MDVYQIVTDKIVGMLEAGVVPWRKPWSSAGLPRNLVTKKTLPGHQRATRSRLNDSSKKGGESERTRCSITGSLPAHAALATARCEAAGTK
jgi:antirestriction protein ArdC